MGPVLSRQLPDRAGSPTAPPARGLPANEGQTLGASGVSSHSPRHLQPPAVSTEQGAVTGSNAGSHPCLRQDGRGPQHHPVGCLVCVQGCHDLRACLYPKWSVPPLQTQPGTSLTNSVSPRSAREASLQGLREGPCAEEPGKLHTRQQPPVTTQLRGTSAGAPHQTAAFPDQTQTVRPRGGCDALPGAGSGTEDRGRPPRPAGARSHIWQLRAHNPEKREFKATASCASFTR